MEYVFLGRSGLSVSRIAFGTATFGGRPGGEAQGSAFGETDVPEASRLVGMCREAGVNLFNTADTYGAGSSEVVLGKALGDARKEVLIATKASMRVGPGPNDVGSSRYHLIRSCEASLRRLGTEWIDLYLLHFPDSFTPLEESCRALNDLVRSGKVRYIGCSNFSAWRIMKALGIADRQNLERFVVQEVSYSLVDRSVECELVPLAHEEGVGLTVWGPLAGGFLSGKFQRGQSRPKGTRLEAIPNYPAIPDWNMGFKILDSVREIAAARGVTPGQVALNWLQRKPWVQSILLGARNEEQLQDNLKSCAWTLTREEVDRLDKVSATVAPYPYSMQVSDPDRHIRLSNYRP